MFLGRNIGIGYRLAAGFVAVIAFGLAGYFNASQALEQYVRYSHSTQSGILRAIGLAKDLTIASHQITSDTTAFVFSSEDSFRMNAWQADSQSLKQYANLMKAMGPYATNPRIGRLMSDLDANEKLITGPVQARVIGLAADGRGTEARRLYETSFVVAANSLDRDVSKLVQLLESYERQVENSQRTQADGAIRAGWLVQGAVSLLIALCVLRAVSTSMSQFLRAQAALRSREERFKALSRNATDVTVILDKEAGIGFVDAAAERNWGYQPDDLVGKQVLDFVHADDHAKMQELLDRATAAPNSDILSEIRLLHVRGDWCPSEVVANNLTDEPSIKGIVLTCRDISERKSLQQELAHQAFHDALTGLPNRALFLDRLEHALSRAQRRHDLVAVCVLDLDNFKVVNDSLGHPAGDQLIVQVTERLRAAVRAGDTVARLGGDEFGILLESLNTQDESIKLVERVTDELALPITIEGHPMFVTTSTGIAVSDLSEQDSGRLMRNADIAMYRAKTNGKARHAIFDDSMTSDALERLELEADLRDAIENGQLRVYYQPIVDLESGKVAEVEALVRWEHPTRGLIPPIKFIPIAEDTGLIVPLGAWVLREACRQTAEWAEEFPRDPALMVGVNLSARQLQHPDLIAEVSAVLQETRLSPELLRLEITESLTVENAEWTQLRLRALRALGVKLAVDDFGTGYSSMAYLSNFPVDTLKIDRCFVNKIAEPEGAAIIQAIISLANTLNLNVTGEGIETQEQLRLLQVLGCHEGQGYYFSRPVTAPAMAAMLTRNRLMPSDAPSPKRIPTMPPRRMAA